MRRFPVYRQLDDSDCGPTCLRMIAKYYGKTIRQDYLANLAHVQRDGVSIVELGRASERIGFKSALVELNFQELDDEVGLPCILYWNRNHYVVLPPQNFNKKKDKVIKVVDPAFGKVDVPIGLFFKSWLQENGKGYALLLEPSDDFQQFASQEERRSSTLTFIYKYWTPYKRYVFQIIMGMIVSSLLSMAIPFLTQSLVDYGVGHRDINFINLVIAGQIAITLGAVAIDVIRTWLMVHINSRVNISIISDFLLKLMKLPTRFFDSKNTSDLIQRITDHGRIEYFLTNSLLTTVFSSITLIILSIVLLIYSGKVFLFFIIGSAASIAWIAFFLGKRRTLDYQNFQQKAASQESIYELIFGMQDIKLNNAETIKRWTWERIQVKIFKLRVDGVHLDQLQQLGNFLFIQLKNIIISYFAAVEVVSGQITLGMMLSITYIIGQLNGPIERLLGFIKSAQDAKISLERLNEIHSKENEEDEGNVYSGDVMVQSGPVGDLSFDNVSFQYSGVDSKMVIRDCSFTIPEGKTSAIVGVSGCGKTTLLKLMLKVYTPVAGSITYGDADLNSFSPSVWRDRCGSVMQDGFIFSDTIAGNIAMTAEVNYKRLSEAIRIAHLQEFIQSIPKGVDTKIGTSGIGISSGQRLRILIARSVYRDPSLIFFDEATSVLDAKTERITMDNIRKSFKGKTVVLVAHRLSTVIDADQILVMHEGQIVESGTHQSLLERKGRYFDLIRNQLGSETEVA